MNEVAKKINDEIRGSVAFEALSKRGKEAYFPKGIVWQAAEAKEKSSKYNATVGLSRIHGKPFYQNELVDNFKILKETQIVSYAPCKGDEKLRELWKQDMLKKNPTLKDKAFSLPIVTSGLTHALNICATLFFDAQDTVLIGSPYWDNYDLLFTENIGTKIKTFDVTKLNSFKKAITSAFGKTDFIKILFNFPNNPTGYTPTEEEVDSFVAVIKERAQAGQKVLVLFDDAYYGLFYDDSCFNQSLFTKFCDLDENVLAVKIDGATKENLAWGLRIGFITFSSKNFNKKIEEVLTEKISSLIRGTVSSSSRVSQSLLIEAISNEADLLKAKNWVFTEMKERYEIVQNFLKDNKSEYLTPVKFNSGYFMCFRVSGQGDALRVYLLENYGIGTISFKNNGAWFLRIAYCSVDSENIKPMLSLIFKATDLFFSL